MSDDPRTDFFASGGDTSPAAAQDARTAFFASGGQSEAPPTVYDANLFRKRVGRDPEPAELANFKASKGVGWAGDPTQGKFTIGQAAIGAGEDALSLGTGAVASIPAAGAYLYGLTGANGTDSLSAARATRNALTYQPRSEAGQAGLDVVGQIRPGEIVPRLLDVAGYGNAAQTVREVEERAGDVAPLAGEAAAGFPITRGVGKRAFAPIQDPESGATAADVVANTVKNSPQSMGAAAASPRISSVSPELQQGIVSAAQRTGGAINPHALGRQVEADTLPVPIRLTEGEALGDVARISNERNSAALAEFYNDRNGKLKQNIQAIRDDVGPDVFTTNAVQHGDTLIDAYQAKDKVARAQIDSAYDAARKAIPPKTPVLDANKLLTNVSSQLEDKWATESAPADIMKRLQTIADGSGTITAAQFEGLRSRLAELARSNDGNTRYAAHLIRGVVEDSDLLPGTEAFKKPFDQARGLARSHFQELEADPAYNAAVNGIVSPDRFVSKFVTGGDRDNVSLMRDNLKDNPTALQTMGVAALDHLRDAAKVNPDGTGAFTQAGFNRALRGLDPKIRSLFDPAHADTLEQLGNVARYTQEQPAGNYINNSKTFVASAAEHGAGLVEGAVNAAATTHTGIPLPAGTMGRKYLDRRAQKAALKRITAPGAGLDVLEEKP